MNGDETEENKKEYQKVSTFSSKLLGDNELVLPIFSLTPYEIFSNKYNIFSVNIFNEKKDDDTLVSDLRETVRDWYITLRLIAIVGMMSTLVYIGIRIVLSSTADSKAKYKQMLWDWLIAIFLVFVMHYIMIFANLIVESVIETIDSIHVELKDKNSATNTIIEEQGVEGFFLGTVADDNGNIEIDPNSTELIQRAYNTLIGSDGGSQGSIANNYKFYFWKNLDGEVAESSNDAKVLVWRAENFTTQARMYAQKARTEDGESGDYKYIGYGLIYVILTIYTIIFSWTYLRRLIYMVFLTLISPLVALTYPIDKVKDGQAQAFNFWFREYLYNLLIQPVHFLLYMLLIGSAMRFATENPIYVIVALGFMVPAEKLIKAMFGFKGQTPGAMPGVAAGALMMHATRKLFGSPPKPSNLHSSSNGGSGSGNDSDVPTKINSPKPYGNNNLFGVDAGGENSTLGGAGETGNSEELDDQGSQMQNLIDNLDTASNGSNGNGGSALAGSTSNSSNNGSSSVDANPNRSVGWLGATGRAAINGVRGRVKNTLGSGKWWGNNVKKGIRFTGGALLGATGASLGGLATIVSGDPSKALENMSLGGLAGYKFGSGGAGAITDGVIGAIGTAKNAIEQEYYAGNPEEYAKKQMNDYIKKWKDDQNNMAILRRQLGNNAANELINGDGLREYIESGFTDVKDIAAGELFKNNYDNLSTRDAIDVLQMNKQIAGGNFTNLHDQDKQKWRDDMKKKFEKYTSDEKVISANVDQAEKYLESISSIRTKIQ